MFLTQQEDPVVTYEMKNDDMDKVSFDPEVKVQAYHVQSEPNKISSGRSSPRVFRVLIR